MANKRDDAPRMAEIAAELGLSRSTISSVLNGRAEKIKIAPATIKLVLEHLAKRGYAPSHHARILRSAQERVIGILHIDDIGTHLVEALNLLTRRFSTNSMGLELMVTPRHRVTDAVRELRSRRVTDLIWIHNSRTHEEYRDAGIANYLIHMRPIVYNYIFGSPFGEASLLSQGFSLVGVNRTEGRRKLAGFLYRCGHRRIAFPDLNDDEALSMYADTFEPIGFKIIGCPPPFDGKKIISLVKKQGITAIHFNGDSPACQAICDLRALGVDIPGDLTVTSFDGTSQSHYKDLTTLEVPIQEMVQRTVDIIGGTVPSGSHFFDLKLLKNKTHGSLKAKAIR